MRWAYLFLAAACLSHGSGSGPASHRRFCRGITKMGGCGARMLLLRGGGGLKEEFPTLGEAAARRSESCSGEVEEEEKCLRPRGTEEGGEEGVERGSGRERDQHGCTRDPGSGGAEQAGDEDEMDVGGAYYAWEMKKGAGDGMWMGSDYVMLRHKNIGTSIELLASEEHFSFLFSCRRGGEVRAYLGASGTAFTSGFCASIQTAKDSGRRVEGNHGVWSFHRAEGDAQIALWHRRGTGCGQLVLTARGFVFFPEADPQVIVVEDAKMGKMSAAAAREMLQSGSEMLPFASKQTVQKRGPGHVAQDGGEEGAQEDGEDENEDEDTDDRGDDEASDAKLGDLLATGRDTVAGYDGVLEPEDEVMALEREKRDERGRGLEEMGESEEEERRRYQNIFYEKPLEIDSQADPESHDPDDDYGEFMRPLGKEWANYRHPTGKQWTDVGPQEDDAKTHTQFSYLGMSVADVVNSKYEEKDNKNEIFRRAREDLIRNGDARDDDEAAGWLRDRGGPARDGMLYSDVKHALYMVEAHEVASVREAFDEMDREKAEYDDFSEGEVDHHMIGTGKFEVLKSLAAARDEYARSKGELPRPGVDWAKGDVPPEGPVRSSGVFLGGLQIDPEQLDEWEEERREHQTRMGPPNALAAAASAQRQADKGGMQKAANLFIDTVALTKGTSGPVALANANGPEGRRMCYFDEWDGKSEGKMMDADVLEGVVTASKRSARLGQHRRKLKKNAIGVIEGGMAKAKYVPIEQEISGLEARLKELKAMGKVKDVLEGERAQAQAIAEVRSGIAKWAKEDVGMSAEQLLRKYIGTANGVKSVRAQFDVGSQTPASRAIQTDRGIVIRHDESRGEAKDYTTGENVATAGSVSVKNIAGDGIAAAMGMKTAQGEGVLGSWGKGNAATKLFRSAASVQGKEALPADMAVHEAVQRASDLLRKAKERALEARASSNASASLYHTTPEWLAPVKLSDAGQDQELADDDAGDEVEWDGDLTWAAGGKEGAKLAEDDGFVMEVGDGEGTFAGANIGGLGKVISFRDASEVWDIVQGRGMGGYGYTVLRLRTIGTVVELFHDSDDGHFRFMPAKGLPREKAADGSLLWKGTFTSQILTCARWGDFWERSCFNAHSLVRRVTERAGWGETRFPEHGSVAAGLWTVTIDGPLLRITWALDHDADHPAVTFLSPDGVLHFGDQRVVQVSMGRDPVRLPRYVFKLPEDLTIKGKPRFHAELAERLEWYKTEAGSLPLLIEACSRQTMQSTARAPSQRPLVARRRHRPEVDWIGSSPVQLPSL